MHGRLLNRLEESRRAIPVDDESQDAELERRASDIRRLSRRYNDGAVAEWEAIADRMIAKHGLPVVHDTPAYRALVQDIAEASIDALSVFTRRQTGEIDAQPRSRVFAASRKQSDEKAPAGQTVLELFERYARQRLAEGKKRPDTVTQDRKVVDLFASFVGGDRAIGSISQREALEWRDTLASLPPNYRKRADFKGLGMRAAAEKATKEGLLGLNPITLNKYLSTVSPLFAWSVQLGYVTANPFDKLFFNLNKAANPRPPFSTEQLNTMLTSPLFTGFLRDGCEHQSGTVRADDWRFWIPIVCLFTGSRIGEVSQLHVGDVVNEHGDWFIHVRDDAKTGQRTKSGKSRTLPVHRVLQEIGFLRFHTEQATRAFRDGNRRLFPDLQANDRDQIGAKPSRFLRSYLTKIGLKEGRDGFGAHSFRHRMADELRSAGYMDAELGPLILGHSDKSVTSGYGRIPQGTAAKLREMMDAVTFDGVRFDHFRR